MRKTWLIVLVVVLAGSLSVAAVADQDVQIAQRIQLPKVKLPAVRLKLPQFLLNTPDLQVTVGGPERAVSGKSIDLKVTVSNKGKAVAKGTQGSPEGTGYMVDIVLSEDSRFPVEYAVWPGYDGKTEDDFVEDMLMRGGRISNTTDLKPGASRSYSVSVPIPSKTPPGLYCVGAVVDPGTRILEMDETNNRTCLKVQIGAAPSPGTNPPQGVNKWVMPWGIGGTKLYQIQTDGLTDAVGPAGGVAINDAPFGGRLGFRSGHSRNIPGGNITHYRWIYRPATGGSWEEFTEAVNIHYVKEEGGDTTFPVYNLGPNSIGGKTLYEFRPDNPPSIPGATTYWPTTNWFGDIYSGFLNSQRLNDGKYIIRLEVYDSSGSQISPGSGTFQFIVPTGTAPNGTVNTKKASTTPGGGVQFTLHVDNRSCDAVIDNPRIGSETVADRCGFLLYPSKSSNVRIAFHATHPANHAVFRFFTVRATDEVTSAADVVNSTSVSGYTGDGSGNFYKNFAVSDLLGPCPEKAAFSENLHVHAKATNGWTRLRYLDAYDVRAFALAPQVVQ